MGVEVSESLGFMPWALIRGFKDPDSGIRLLSVGPLHSVLPIRLKFGAYIDILGKPIGNSTGIYHPAALSQVLRTSISSNRSLVTQGVGSAGSALFPGSSGPRVLVGIGLGLKVQGLGFRVV